jgi:tetratricopeptide (TPR) repeat protein
MEQQTESSGQFGTLLRTLARNLRTGTVLVRSGKRQKLLHIEEGVVRDVYARTSRFRLGDILFRARAIERAQLQEALAEQRRTGKPIGEVLISRADVTDRQLREAMEYRLVEEVLEIYYWKDLRFEFLGESADRFVESAKFTRIPAEMDAEEMVRRVEKTVADIERFNEVTPSLRDVYELTADAVGYLREENLDPGLRDFLLLLDGQRDMKEVLREMRMNRFDVLEFFYRLRTEEKIRAKNGFELLMLAENQKQDLSPQKLLRLYERVRELGVEGFEVSKNLAELCVELQQPRRAAKFFVEMARKAVRDDDTDRATEAAHRALELVPGDVSLRRSLVDVLRSAGRPKEGAEELRDLATVHRDRGELAEARKALMQAAEVLTDPRTREELGSILLEQRDGAGARRAFREAARFRAEVGEADRALQNLINAAQADPDHLGARLELAEAFAHCDRAPEALHAVSALAGLASRARPVETGAQDILIRAAKLATEVGTAAHEAVSACARALGILGNEEESRRLWASVGDEYLGAGAFPEAVVALREVLTIDPADEPTRETLAMALKRAGDEPASGAEWRLLAEAREGREDRAGAEDAWRALLEVCPFDLDARNRLAQCAEDLGRDEDAALLYLELGDVLRVAGRDDEAIEAYRRSRKLCSQEPKSLGRLISAFESLGLQETGVEVRRALLELQRSREDWAGLFRAAWDLRQLEGEDEEIGTALDLALDRIREAREATPAETAAELPVETNAVE